MSELEAEKESVWHGGCLCGAVRYQIKGALRDVLICHCVTCRRQHTLIGAYTACEPSQLVLPISEGLAWFASSAEASRGFCNRCGAGLFWALRHGRYISVAVGSLDAPEALELSGHMYTHQALGFLSESLPGGVGSAGRVSEADAT